MEDRSALFNQLKNFSQRKLKKVETKVVTASGEQLVEKRGAKGLQVLTGGADGAKGDEVEPPRKLDLQVGLIIPGFLIGSQDVAHDKSSLESYGVTHILNLDSGIENKFEDDYNYKNVNIQDKPDYELEKILEDCFDFIDDGRHYGNVLVHCAGTIGLSRSTAICIAYLMNKEQQKFDDAFNNVKEARSFVKPNEGFIKQLKDYEVKLRGAQEVKDSGIDDPFALRKKQEIEKEKAMVAGAASVKNRMKMFGANLDANAAGANSAARSKSVSPAPFKQPTTSNSTSVTTNNQTSKWSSNLNRDSAQDSSSKSLSKSMTPEPRKSWQPKQDSTPEWRADSKASSGLPPPPPPMPANLLADQQSSARQPPPPPPPPPMPTGDLAKDPINKSTLIYRNQEESQAEQRMVFGRVKPPAMKIKGGLSIERQDSTSDSNMGFKKPSTQSTKSSLQLPLKKQHTLEPGSEGENQEVTPRAPSPSAALRAAKQQAASRMANEGTPASEARSHDQPRQSVCGQLNRSSTKKLLNLIKTKTKSDLTLPDGDENDEIEALLGALESESFDNIDWDELGLDENEVKDIIEKGVDQESSSSSSSSDDDEDDQDEEYEEELETSSQHYVIRTK